MKNGKKVFVILVFLCFLSQILFICNQLKIGRIAQKIVEINANKTDFRTTDFNDYKGVIHVHTAIGGHLFGFQMKQPS